MPLDGYLRIFLTALTVALRKHERLYGGIASIEVLLYRIKALYCRGYGRPVSCSLFALSKISTKAYIWFSEFL